MIRNEEKVCKYLNIPSIPKKEWDGVRSFKFGVAVVKHNEDDKSYAVATFDSETDVKPRIVKVFDIIPFREYETIYVVPSYMDIENVDKWDLDDKSKKAAELIVEEVRELEGERIDESKVPENEYCYDFITNDEEALAFIRDYNIRNGIKKGRTPNTHDGIITRLTSIWLSENNKNKKNNKKRRK